MLYDVIEHLKKRFTLGAYATLVQRAIEDSGGSFQIRREVFSNLFVSFCNQIRDNPLDQVCSLAIGAAAGSGDTSSSTAQLPCCCDTVSIDGCRFAPSRELDDGEVDERETVAIPRQLRTQRYFVVEHPGTRLLLIRWAGLPPKGPPDKSRGPVIFTEADNVQLSQNLSKYASFLQPLMSFAESHAWVGVPRADKAACDFFRIFIRSVACAHVSYPIITAFVDGKLDILQSTALQLEGAESTDGFARHVAALSAQGVPAFGELLTHFFLHGLAPGDRLLFVHLLGSSLRHMVSLAASYHQDVEKCLKRLRASDLLRERVSREDDLKRGACFPPAQRYRLVKKLDLPSDSTHGQKGAQRATCEYWYKETDPLAMFLPCILLFWCMCGINIGFQVLKRPESLTAITTSFLERYPRMPGRLYYDFSCGLMRSVVGAAPWHFERTALCHDPMHGKGHCSSCSAAYAVKYAVQATVRRQNSVVAEQRNARVRAFDRTIAFMSLTFASILLAVLLASMNADKKHAAARKARRKARPSKLRVATRSADHLVAVLPVSPAPAVVHAASASSSDAPCAAVAPLGLTKAIITDSASLSQGLVIDADPSLQQAASVLLESRASFTCAVGQSSMSIDNTGVTTLEVTTLDPREYGVLADASDSDDDDSDADDYLESALFEGVLRGKDTDSHGDDSDCDREDAGSAGYDSATDDGDAGSAFSSDSMNRDPSGEQTCGKKRMRSPSR